MYLNKEPLKANEKARFILIKESANDLFGMKVLKTIIKTFCKENASIAIINYDFPKEDLLYGINARNIDLEYIPGFGANSSECVNNTFSMDNLKERFFNYDGVVCLNSLTSLLIHDGADYVYKTLHHLLINNDKLQIVALVCADVHNAYENELIDRLSSTILYLDLKDAENRLQSVVCHPSGKVSCLALEYQISAAFKFSSLVDAKLQVKKKPAQQPDPTANLTFNLRLKDKELTAKNQLQLPYMKKQISEEAIIQGLVDNDLYDEEDPDDDLDI